jgi:general secretion pathway protein C
MHPIRFFDIDSGFRYIRGFFEMQPRTFERRMFSFFQRYYQGIFFLLLALLGLSLGQLAATGLGFFLAPPVTIPDTRAGQAPPPPPRPVLADYQGVLQRDIFDSTAHPVLSLTPLQNAPQKEAASTPRQNLTLLGTVAAGKASLAVIGAGQDIKVFRLGEEVSGGGKVEEVHRNLVKIRYADGAVEDLPLYEGEKGKEASAPAPPTAAGAGNGYAVKPVGENRWVIPKEEAEKARGNLNELLKQARLEPNIVDGRTDGFAVRMIRPNSLLALLGLKVGDIVLQVNGMDLNSPEKALQIFQQLREAKHISIGLRRNGSPLTFEYEVD